ncbi:hypothetical protein, partial [Vibrio parahaemolyticus]|uniref:hypothetical protein n=1 Tax=Vibrio parahaemolyticus TaxID=670 RepID=UPI0021141CB3
IKTYYLITLTSNTQNTIPYIIPTQATHNHHLNKRPKKQSEPPDTHTRKYTKNNQQQTKITP